jgi:hypothetical protein
MIRGNEAPRAGHVFHDHGWIPRQMFVHMPGDRPTVDVKAAPGAEADHDPHGFVFIERLLGAGRHGDTNDKTDTQQNRQELHTSSFPARICFGKTIKQFVSILTIRVPQKLRGEPFQVRPISLCLVGHHPLRSKVGIPTVRA